MIAPVWAWAAKWLAVAAAVAALLLGVRRQGRKLEQAESLKQLAEDVEKAREADRSVDRLRDGDAADELRKHWTR